MANEIQQEQDTPTRTAAWPPPPRPRPRSSRISLIMRISVGTLALLLVISGLFLVVYSTTVGYRTTQHVIATSEVRATQNVTSTALAQQRATAGVLGTAQANINVTATAQTDASTLATTTVDGATATATSLSTLLTQSTTKNSDFNDALSDNTGAGKWDEGSKVTTSVVSTACTFKDGTYHVSEAQKGLLQPCLAQSTNFSNFVYEVQVTLNQGQQGQTGLLFQVDSSDKDYYYFYIRSDGTYALDLYNSNGQANLVGGTSAAITTGLSQSNQLAVLAKDGVYYLYANSQYLATVTDHSLSAGRIGLAVVDNNAPVDAQFSNAQVWKL